MYDEGELPIVHKIRSMQELGFELDELSPFVTCMRAGNPSGDECPESMDTLRRRLTEVNDAIDELLAIRELLHRQLATAESKGYQ